MAEGALFDATPYRVHTTKSWDIRPRIVDPRGYVLIRLPGHHRADIRGYVYEHVLVMESALGRQLRPGERVRHRDGNSGNNSATNLELRTPPDRQRRVACACGCGIGLTAIDPAGRPRSYVVGHNPQQAPSRDAVLAALAASVDSCLTPAQVAQLAGLGRNAAKVTLSKLAGAGLVERPRVGYYRLPGTNAFVPPSPQKRPKWEWGSGLPVHLKESLTEDFGGLCAYGCWRLAVTWDHLIPWARGGSFRWPGNVVPACKPCNISKNNRAPGPWVSRALSVDYSSDPMEGVITLAICWGAADPDDFYDPALDEYPEEVPDAA